MKIIGLLGGMSWQSTAGYYKAINEGIKVKPGGLHSAQIVMFSVDFSLFCTNTLHKIASQIEQVITIPILHIADATAEVLVKNSITTVGLLGTAFTLHRNKYADTAGTFYGTPLFHANRAVEEIC